jgi:hypothetical protein
MPVRKAWGLGLMALGFTSAVGTELPRSTVRTPQFENDSVRVWKTSIAPGQPLTMHRHESARVIVALTDGTLRIVKGSGESRTDDRPRPRVGQPRSGWARSHSITSAACLSGGNTG